MVLVKKHMKHIQKNILAIQEKINKLNPKTYFLVATKYASLEETLAVIENGIIHLGENKVQDAEKKILSINNPNISWHLLGHLQSNKVNKAVALFDYIQSVDSLKLAQKINQAAQTLNKIQKILIQINIGEEEQKTGFSIETFTQNLDSILVLHNIQILGIMVIVPHTTSEKMLRHYFSQTKKLFDETKTKCPHINMLSMGMSEDFEIAIQEGSTLVRIGRSIFNK